MTTCWGCIDFARDVTEARRDGWFIWWPAMDTRFHGLVFCRRCREREGPALLILIARESARSAIP